MSTNRPHVVVVFGGAATLVVACGLAIDPDDLIAANGASTNITGEGGSGDGDAASDAPPPCKPTGAEVCDDGIDNDCNGSADCADPKCYERFECVDGPPDGWDLILLSTDEDRPKCPTGYGASTNVRVVEGDGSLTCGCDCGNNCGATITLTKGTELTCTDSPSTDTFQNQNDPSKCTGKSSFNLGSGFAKVTSSAGTCNPTETATKGDLVDGRTCAPQNIGAGCPGSQRCVPKKNTSELTTCIAKAGSNACPATAYKKPWRSGTSATDQRSCAGCVCDSNPCTVELDLWIHPSCQGAANLTIGESCDPNGAVSNLRSYKVKTTSGCSLATPSTSQGAIVFTNEQTICCP